MGKCSRASIYDKAYVALTDMIEDLRTRQLDRLPSESELARTLGVSLVTVRRALATLARERQIDRQHGRGTFILPRKKTRAIWAVVQGPMAGLFSRYTAAVMRGISMEAEASGEQAIQFEQIPEWGDSDLAERLIRRVRGGEADGYLIVSPIHLRDVLRLREADIPLVMVEINYGLPNIPSVLVNHRAAGVLAGQYLAERWCQQLALVTGPVGDETIRAGQSLMDGLAEVLGPDVVRRASRHVTAHWTAKEGYEALAHILERCPLPEVIVAASDEVASGILAALRKQGLDGLHSPELLGYVQTPELFPGVTVQFPSSEELGRCAVRMLRQLMNGEKLKEKEMMHWLQPRFIAGESGPARSIGPDAEDKSICSGCTELST